MTITVTPNRRRPPRGRAGSYRISIRDNGLGSYRNSIYMTWLNDAVNYFQNIVIGPSLTLTLDVSFSNLGTPPSTLGQCGPGTGNWWEWTTFAFTDFEVQGSSAFLTMAKMEMNYQYFQINPTSEEFRLWKEQFFAIAVHEIFHGVGFGALWSGSFKILTADDWTWIPDWLGGGGWIVTTLPDVFFPFGQSKNVVGGGSPATARYTASRGLAAWRDQMQGQAGAGNIPIENINCGTYTTMAAAGGSALSHWQRDYLGRNGIAGVLNRKDQDGRNELMTGWSGYGMMGEYGREEWVSRFSIESLRDIGYSVNSELAGIPLHYWKSQHY